MPSMYIMMLVVFTGFAGLVAATSMTGVSMHPVMAAIATLAVALGWWLVAKYCWPDQLDDEEPAAPGGPIKPADEKRP